MAVKLVFDTWFDHFSVCALAWEEEFKRLNCEGFKTDNSIAIHCLSGDSRDIDFNKDENRLNYIIRHGYNVIALVEKCVLDFLREQPEIGNNIFHGNIKLCSLSNGPGFDIVGFLSALQKLEVKLPHVPSFIGINLFQSWQYMFQWIILTVYQKYQPEMFQQIVPQENLFFHSCDIFSTPQDVESSIADSDVLFMAYVFQSSKANLQIVRDTMMKIFTQLKGGSFIFYIGSKSNVERVLKIASEDDSITVNYGPMKISLEKVEFSEPLIEKTGIEPKLSDKSYFAVFQKEERKSKKCRRNRKKRNSSIQLSVSGNFQGFSDESSSSTLNSDVSSILDDSDQLTVPQSIVSEANSAKLRSSEKSLDIKDVVKQAVQKCLNENPTSNSPQSDISGGPVLRSCSSSERNTGIFKQSLDINDVVKQDVQRCLNENPTSNSSQSDISGGPVLRSCSSSERNTGIFKQSSRSCSSSERNTGIFKQSLNINDVVKQDVQRCLNENSTSNSSQSDISVGPVLRSCSSSERNTGIFNQNITKGVNNDLYKIRNELDDSSQSFQHLVHLYKQNKDIGIDHVSKSNDTRKTVLKDKMLPKMKDCRVSEGEIDIPKTICQQSSSNISSSATAKSEDASYDIGSLIKKCQILIDSAKTLVENISIDTHTHIQTMDRNPMENRCCNKSFIHTSSQCAANSCNSSHCQQRQASCQMSPLCNNHGESCCPYPYLCPNEFRPCCAVVNCTIMKPCKNTQQCSKYIQPCQNICAHSINMHSFCQNARVCAQCKPCTKLCCGN